MSIDLEIIDSTTPSAQARFYKRFGFAVPVISLWLSGIFLSVVTLALACSIRDSRDDYIEYDPQDFSRRHSGTPKTLGSSLGGRVVGAGGELIKP
jgi:hypothetical protein